MKTSLPLSFISQIDVPNAVPLDTKIRLKAINLETAIAAKN